MSTLNVICNAPWKTRGATIALFPSHKGQRELICKRTVSLVLHIERSEHPKPDVVANRQLNVLVHLNATAGVIHSHRPFSSFLSLEEIAVILEDHCEHHNVLV